MRTQIQIDCEVTMKAMGAIVIESRINTEKKEVVFYTEVKAPLAVQQRINIRFQAQQPEYKPVFKLITELESDQEGDEK